MRIRVGEGMNRGCDRRLCPSPTQHPEEHTGRLLLCARTVSCGILGPGLGTKDLLSLSWSPTPVSSVFLEQLLTTLVDRALSIEHVQSTSTVGLVLSLALYK